MSGRAGKRPSRSLSEKLAAIHRVRNGESKAAVGRDIGVPESTLRGWCKNENKISRQCNNPDTDESLQAHSRNKKKKPSDSSMQPLDLSLRNNSSYSPSSEERCDVNKTDQEQTKTPLNLHMKMDATPKASSRSKNREEKFAPHPALNQLTANINVMAQYSRIIAQLQHDLQYGSTSTRTTTTTDSAAYAAYAAYAARLLFYLSY